MVRTPRDQVRLGDYKAVMAPRRDGDYRIAHRKFRHARPYRGHPSSTFPTQRSRVALIHAEHIQYIAKADSRGLHFNLNFPMPWRPPAGDCGAQVVDGAP